MQLRAATKPTNANFLRVITNDSIGKVFPLLYTPYLSDLFVASFRKHLWCWWSSMHYPHRHQNSHHQQQLYMQCTRNHQMERPWIVRNRVNQQGDRYQYHCHWGLIADKYNITESLELKVNSLNWSSRCTRDKTWPVWQHNRRIWRYIRTRIYLRFYQTIRIT